jgi:hypothetical protein
MIHFQGHPAQSANQNRRSLFGGSRVTIGGTPGTTNMAPNSWLPRALNIYEFNHIRGAAITAAHSVTWNIYDGGTIQAALTMDDTDGTDETATFTATLTAATSAANSECHIIDHVQTGVTANALGTSALVYQDASAEEASYYCVGDATNSISSIDAGRFLAICGAGGTGSTVEASTQMPIVVTSTLRYIAVRYTDVSGATAANFEIRTVASSGAGVVHTAIPLPSPGGAGSVGIVVDTSLSVPLAVSDLLSFRLIRTSGAGTTMQCNAVFGITT